MPANANPLRIVNLPAAVAVAQFVAVDSTGAIASAGQRAIGFTTAAAKAGGAAPVCVMGSAAAWAGAAISLGQALEVGANGSVVPLSGGTQIGTALNAAASGDQVEVLIGAAAPVSGARNLSGVILFGDSREEYEQNINANGIYNNARGAFMQANAMADRRMKLVRNAGIGGNTYADLKNRYLTDVRPYASQASILIIVCGINDVNAATMRDLADIKADATWIHDRAEEDGLRVIETVDYCPGVGKEWSAARNATWFGLNAWKRSLPQVRKNFYLQDWAKVLVNPTAATPSVASSNLLDPSPGVALHLNGQGAFKAAKYGGLLDIIKLLVPSSNKLVASVSDNYGYDATNPNIIDTGLFQGTGGTHNTGSANDGAPDAGFTAGVATGWNSRRTAGAGAVATSVGPSSSGIGNAQRLKITGVAGSGETYQFGIVSSIHSRVVAGGRYQARCRVVIKNPVNLHTVYLRILATAGTAWQWRDMAETVPVSGGIPEDVTYTLETPDDMVLPNAAVTNFEVQVLAVFSGAGSATIDVEQLSCSRLPD